MLRWRWSAGLVGPLLIKATFVQKAEEPLEYAFRPPA